MKSPDHLKDGDDLVSCHMCTFREVLQNTLTSSGRISDCELRQYPESITIYNEPPINPERHFPNRFAFSFFFSFFLIRDFFFFCSGFFRFSLLVKAGTLSQSLHFFFLSSPECCFNTADAGGECQYLWETVDCICVWFSVAHFLCTVHRLLLKISCASINEPDVDECEHTHAHTCRHYSVSLPY